MKYYDLDDEEKQILGEFEADKFAQIKGVAKKKSNLQEYARNTLNKTKNINLRLPEKLVLKLKAKAAAQGLPYQTLASSILHRFVNSL